MVSFPTGKLKKFLFFSQPESGQVLLIVVLVLVVVVTIGLSLATRSLTNQRQSREDQSSEQAFSAAEAGIQVALKQSGSNSIPITQFSNGTTYKADVRTISSNQIAVNGGNSLIKNEGVDVWMSTYPVTATSGRWNGTLTINWDATTNTNPCNAAALEVLVLSGANKDAPVLAHYAYDPCTQRFPANNFTTQNITVSNVTIQGKQYRYSVTLPVIANGILMRIVPVYANTSLAVTTAAGTPFPVQGKVIESTGISGGTQRKIVVLQGNPKVPLEMFPYILFTPL